MTSQQCAERQAARDNLVRELCEALQWYVDTDEVSNCAGNEFWMEGKTRAEALLARAKEQQ